MRELSLYESETVSGGLVGGGYIGSGPGRIPLLEAGQDVVDLGVVYISGSISGGQCTPYDDYNNNTLFFSQPGSEYGVPFEIPYRNTEPGLQTVFTIPLGLLGFLWGTIGNIFAPPPVPGN